MARPARVAIYYAPLPDDPLTGLSSAWLGRDPIANASVPQPALSGIAEFTAEPRSYGFHATLKPPMHLAEGTDWTGLVAAVREVATGIAPFELPPLRVCVAFWRYGRQSPALLYSRLPMRVWNSLIRFVHRHPSRNWRGDGMRNCRPIRMQCCCDGDIHTCSTLGFST
jgi:hypothetical protein